MLVVAKHEEMPLGPAARFDVGAKIALEQIPTDVAPVDVVRVLQPVHREDDFPAFAHDVGQLGPPFPRTCPAIGVHAEQQGLAAPTEQAQHGQRVSPQDRVAVIAAHERIVQRSHRLCGQPGFDVRRAELVGQVWFSGAVRGRPATHRARGVAPLGHLQMQDPQLRNHLPRLRRSKTAALTARCRSRPVGGFVAPNCKNR